MKQKTFQILSISLFIALLLWGVKVTLVYFGIPVHGAVLLDGVDQQRIMGLCAEAQNLCRGGAALIPSIVYTFTRAQPFLSYVVISAIVYALFLGWYALQTGGLDLRLRLKPWHILGLFVGSVWLMFTVLTAMEINPGDPSTSMRRIVEPHPSVYTKIGPEGLGYLRENFERLKADNCLEKVADYRPDIGLYDMKSSCVQKFFFKRVVSQLVFLLLVSLLFLTLGRAGLQALKAHMPKRSVEFLLSFSLGAGLFILFLWICAVLGILVNKVAWTAIALFLLIFYKHTRYWLLSFFTYTWETRRSWYSLSLICTWLLLSYLALNFITVVRPFPIGWDDLGSYMNQPRLMVSYGKFIPALKYLQWEYLTSIGFLLYGYTSVFGATASMMINWLAGPFAVLSVVVFTGVFLGPGRGVLAGLLYYSLPLVGHFSFADMKIDNALFGFQAAGVLCMFLYLFYADIDSDEENSEESPADNGPLRVGPWQWLFLSGVMCSLAFSIKATAVMVVMALAAILASSMVHNVAFVTGIAGAIAVYTKFRLPVNQINERLGTSVTNNEIMAAAIFVAVATFVYTLWKRQDRVVPMLKSASVFVASFLVAATPWLLHNNIKSGNIIPKVEFNIPNTYQPLINTSGNPEPQYEGQVIRTLPEELQIDPQHALCQSTALTEELDRYWGFKSGWGHYLTLPWRTVMNMDSAGYYVTTSPALLLFPLLLLVPMFWMGRRHRWLRWLFVGTLFIVVQWVFLANGVPWYGLGMFFGLVVGLEALLALAPDAPNRWLAGALICIGLISCFGMRFWQFEQQRNLLEYSMGKASAETMLERTIPHYNNIADIVVTRNQQMDDRPYLYRVGTFIPYFIPKNLEIIPIADHQLDFFNCLHQEGDPALTLKRLQALGFNSVVFDTNTATIEKNKQGSLHKKVAKFVDFLNTPDLGLQVVVNDPAAGVAYILLP